MSVRVTNVHAEVVADEFADAWLEQEGYEERLAAYNDGQFGFVGVRLVGELQISHGDGWIVQEISSPGLWGIEDDSGSDYFESVAIEEYDTFADMLVQLGAALPVHVELGAVQS